VNALALYGNLAGMTVTGVHTKLAAPPRTLSPAQLPAQWAGFPVQQSTRVITIMGGTDSTARATLYVVLEPVNLGTAPANWQQAVSMLNAVEAALQGNTIQLGLVQWTTSLAIIDLGGEALYWTILAEVEAS
jgi:hypothetical protein